MPKMRRGLQEVNRDFLLCSEYKALAVGIRQVDSSPFCVVNALCAPASLCQFVDPP